MWPKPVVPLSQMSDSRSSCELISVETRACHRQAANRDRTSGQPAVTNGPGDAEIICGNKLTPAEVRTPPSDGHPEGGRAELRLIAASDHLTMTRAIYEQPFRHHRHATNQLMDGHSPYSGFESHSLRQLHLTKHSLPARQRAKNFNKHRY